MSVQSRAIQFTTDAAVDLQDGSSLWLERTAEGLSANLAFGAPQGNWITLCRADQQLFEGVLVDMTESGWVGVMVSEPACLLVLRSRSSKLEVVVRVPLRREPLGDRAFRTLNFYVAGRFVVAETESTIVVLGNTGVLHYALPNTWPQTRIKVLDEERIELANERGVCSFELASGPALITPPRN